MSGGPADLLLEVGRHGPLLPLERAQRLLALVRLHQRPVLGALQERLEARLLLGATAGKFTQVSTAFAFADKLCFATLTRCLVSDNDCTFNPAKLWRQRLGMTTALTETECATTTEHAFSMSSAPAGCVSGCAQQQSAAVQNPRSAHFRTGPHHLTALI